jgi:Do/DeqQ family serine protease
LRLKLCVMLILSAVLVTGVSASAESRIENVFRGTLGKFLGDTPVESGATGRQMQFREKIPESRTQIQLTFSPLVKKVAPSVVNVYGTRTAREFRSPFAGDPFFERFFGTPQRRRGQNSLGSGVIVSSDGFVLTNNHVVDKMDKVKIALADGREFECEIVLKDRKSDLAVLQIQSDDEFTPIEIADSDLVEVGDLVLAIGNPFGVGQTVTSGIVSAVSRSLGGANDYSYFIQTDAAINPGNSGGALVDMQGRLIGINTMIYSRSGGSVGIGYAVPSNMTRIILDSARTGDRVTRPWIGATFRNVTPEIAESLGLERPGGALVLHVSDGSPASQAGLRPGDVVLSVDGINIDHPDALGYRLDTAGIGNTAKLTVLTRGMRGSVDIALVAPPETVPRDVREMPRDSILWGATAANLSPALAQEIGLAGTMSGVVLIEVAANSAAAYNGVRSGDIIRDVNGITITDTRILERVLRERYHTWELVVERDGRSYVFSRNGGIFRQFLP